MLTGMNILLSKNGSIKIVICKQQDVLYKSLMYSIYWGNKNVFNIFLLHKKTEADIFLLLFISVRILITYIQFLEQHHRLKVVLGQLRILTLVNPY